MYIKYNCILRRIYKEENILDNLGSLMGVRFKTDWIGRAYTVIHPQTGNNGVYDINTQIFEYGPDGLNNVVGVESWVMKRLNIASQFIRAKNLFDMLTYTIKYIDSNNFLFTLMPVPYSDMVKYGKRFVCILFILILMLAVGIFII